MSYRFREGLFGRRVLQVQDTKGLWADDKKHPTFVEIAVVDAERHTQIAERATQAERRSSQQKAARALRQARQAEAQRAVDAQG